MTESRLGAIKNCTSKPKPTMSEVLHGAIAEGALTMYRIAKNAGLVQTSPMRFMAGKTSVHLNMPDRLAEYLGLELVPRKADVP